MPVVSADLYRVLFTVSRYLFPLLACLIVLFSLAWIITEARVRRENIRHLPGSGMIGELIVLSGSRDLSVNTWFPVPWEGVLGAVRSCDLVIPCPGVQAKHLDFSWQDGKGLVLYPHTGCEIQVNGIPVTCRNSSSVPMMHGSVLQVGSAVLRLHLFAALDSISPQETEAPPVFSNAPAPDSSYVTPVPPFSLPPQQPVLSQTPETVSPPSVEDKAPARHSERPRRSDRWKEDFGE